MEHSKIFVIDPYKKESHSYAAGSNEGPIIQLSAKFFGILTRVLFENAHKEDEGVYFGTDDFAPRYNYSEYCSTNGRTSSLQTTILQDDSNGDFYQPINDTWSCGIITIVNMIIIAKLFIKANVFILLINIEFLYIATTYYVI